MSQNVASFNASFATDCTFGATFDSNAIKAKFAHVITTGGEGDCDVLYYNTYEDLPETGKLKTLYVVKEDYSVYLWDDIELSYVNIGFTEEDKEKLDSIEYGAEVNTVIGVKGNAEEEYRVGEINISPENIGLGNVDNTSDLDKPVSTATQTAIRNAVDTYIHNQLIASDTWTIEHNLGRYPSVTVIDSGDTVVVGDCKYISENIIEVTFAGAFSGIAYLN